jgi:nucleotide-binding universal stress UspA family protein
MSIKRILVPLPGSANHAGEIAMALSAAKSLGAHVEALYISQPPHLSRGGTNLSDMGYGGYYRGATATAAAVDWQADARERAAAQAREQFMQTCAAAGVPMLAPGDLPGSPLAASWREAEGSYEDVAVRRAAGFDLIVAASANVMESLMTIAEQSLLQARRPVLLAPSQLQNQLTDTAMIAWDESLECWHAVSAAIPLLQLAKSVEVVSVDRDPARRKTSQAELMAYLRCHGIAASASVVAPDLRSVGDTLLATAANFDAGLLVMGAYSHSRLREMLLGGATRHILKNATARPVFLAH